MTANELREKYLSFFEKRGHKRIPPSPLVPIDDPTTLFTGSGMQPLIPYLLGERHPLGVRLVDSQLCLRTQDINEIGDNRHTTFFEMLGNWSLGDYFKEEQLPWFFEFLTKEVGLDSKKLYATVFRGNEKIDIPRDEESVEIWKEIFKKEGIETKVVDYAEEKCFQDGRIFYYDETFGNWWSRSGIPDDMPTGEPGGPSSEVFYDFGLELKLHENSPFANKPCHVNCDCGRFLEIGNSVFMEYRKNEKGGFDKLPQKNVDFGGGFERILAAKENQPDIFKTELFKPIIKRIEKVSGRSYQGSEAPMRIMADHLKATTFMIREGLEPSNRQQGYILRRLLRRAAVKMYQLKDMAVQGSDFEEICSEVVGIYKGVYFKDMEQMRSRIGSAVTQEMDKFARCLGQGLREYQKMSDDQLNAAFAFDLFQTYGFPLEVARELFEQRGKSLDKKEFQKIFERHQEKSRTAAKGMFKGGLADSSEEIIKLHTATHLLHQALRDVLGDHVQQVGSNITAERLRFDFTHPEKLTEAEIKQIEEIVNKQIKANLPVEVEVMAVDEAKKKGALAFFSEKYADKVKVYSVGDYSCEVCGGPHVACTGEIGGLKIIKEKPVGSGRRRIYARLA